MSEMVERVARALEASTAKGFASWDEAARAAVLAMREPTPDMVSPGFFADAWRRAIDAVLRDE